MKLYVFDLCGISMANLYKSYYTISQAGIVFARDNTIWPIYTLTYCIIMQPTLYTTWARWLQPLQRNA